MSSTPNFLHSPRSTVAPPDHSRDTMPPTSIAGPSGTNRSNTRNSSGTLATANSQPNFIASPAPSGGLSSSIAANYSPEERVFHQTFPFVPLSEKVVEHYQCSVSRSKVIRIGKLYLTALRMCFVSSFLKDPIHLPWDSVSSIEKKSNFLFETIVVKRTAAAVQLQNEMDLDAKEASKIKDRRSIQGFSGGTIGSGGGAETPRQRASGLYLQTAGPNRTPIDISEVSTGGVGDEEVFSGFITGSSDGAYRMMLMLHSVRARYRRSAIDYNVGLANNAPPVPSPQHNTHTFSPAFENSNNGESPSISPRANALSSAEDTARHNHAAEDIRNAIGDNEQLGGNYAPSYTNVNGARKAPLNGSVPDTFNGIYSSSVPANESDLTLTNGSLTMSPTGPGAAMVAAMNATPKPQQPLEAGFSSPDGSATPINQTLAPPSATSNATTPTSKALNLNTAEASPNNNSLNTTNGAGMSVLAVTPSAPFLNSAGVLTPQQQHTAAGIVGVGETPDIIATANISKDYATAARASLVVTNANEHIVLQSNLQRAMLTDEQRRKLERGGHYRTSSSGGLDPIGAAIATAANSAGANSNGEDFSQHEAILKFFPYVPRTEIVVDQFQCSYAIGVHRIGRLYITRNYLLFSSHFMSDPIIIRLVDIEKVEKFQTIMVLDGFTVHLRPEATRLTVGQIALAGGIVPACAIRAGMMTTNPAEGMTGLPIAGAGHDNTESAAASLAAPPPPVSCNATLLPAPSSGPMTPSSNSPALGPLSGAVSNGSMSMGGVGGDTEGTSRSSSVAVRVAMSDRGSGAFSAFDGATPPASVSPPLSPTPGGGGGASAPGSPYSTLAGEGGGTSPTTSAGPMPFLAAGLPSSSPYVSNTANAYSKPVYTFTSFVSSRDQAMGILQHFCQSHSERVAAIAPRCPQPKEDLMPPPSEEKGKDSKIKKKDKDKGVAVGAEGASAESAVTGSALSATAPAVLLSSNDASPASGVTSPTGVPAAAIAAEVDKINKNGRSWASFRTKTSKPHFYNTFIPATSQEDLAKITTDFTGGLSDVPHFFGKEGAKELISPLKFPQGIDLLDVFYHCFDDDHEILGRYHEDRRDTGQTWEPWRAHLSAGTLSGREDNGTGAPNGLGAGQREMKSKTVIRVVGEKICDYNEFHRYAFFSLNNMQKRILMVQVSGQAQGAMFSDSFRAETLMIFEEEYVGAAPPVGLQSPPADAPSPMPSDAYFNPNRSNTVVTMRCYGYINFLRSVWVRGKILSAALTEMPECYKTLSGMMVKRLSEVTAEQCRRLAATASAAALPIPGAAVALAALQAQPSSDVAAAAEEGEQATSSAHVSSVVCPPSSSPNLIVGGVGGGGGIGGIREALRPNNLFGFLIPTGPAEGQQQKVPIAAVAPAAIVILILAVYSLSSLLSVLLFGHGALPSVVAAREASVAAAAAHSISMMGGASSGLPLASGGGKESVAFASSPTLPSSEMTAAAAISDLYNIALRPLLVIVYGVATLLFGSLGAEYALAVKDGMGL